MWGKRNFKNSSKGEKLANWANTCFVKKSKLKEITFQKIQKWWEDDQIQKLLEQFD